MQDVSRETTEKLEAYQGLVRKWSPKINLVSKGDLADLHHRHVQDSVQIAELAPNAKRWVDLGSGGGFPGIVVALLRPDIDIHLVESDQRKAAFLRTCGRELGRNLTIHAQRIEDIPSLEGDVVSARALAPLPNLLFLVSHHLTLNGTALLPKGQQVEGELAEAQKTWSFSTKRHPSRSRDGAVILQIENITRV